MKKKYWIEIIVFSTIIIVALIVEISIYNSNRDKTEEGLRSFKVETLEKDDGWYYTLEINKFKDESGNEKISSIFNGCNLKYETLDDNYITMTDDNGNIVGSIPMAPPSLNTSYRSKDNIKTEASEVQEINDLLTRLPFDREWNENDFESLELVNIDANDIITLGNNTYHKDYKTNFEKYNNIPECAFLKETKENSYYQVGIHQSYGEIDVVRIDYVDENGMYLSDKIQNGTTNETEKNQYQTMQEIANKVIETQDLSLQSQYEELRQDETYQELFYLLQEMHMKALSEE